MPLAPGEFVVLADCYVGLHRLGTKLVTCVEFIFFPESSCLEFRLFPAISQLGVWASLRGFVTWVPRGYCGFRQIVTSFFRTY